AFSIFATWFGAETCIGSSAAAFSDGLWATRADPFGYTLCLVFMAAVFATTLWKKNIVTLGDLFRQRYSRKIETLAVLIMIPTSLMWAAAQIRAFGQVLSIVYPSSNLEVALTVAAFLVILYTFWGGLMGD